ncbi:MAG: hypothetical protein LBB79_03625 [Prevotellaceae bacterium]|jgi:hypothetical protein|nr:hypothetical protein [Prevotellaceae bacterium]
MVTNTDIMRFAANHKRFTRKELIAHLEQGRQDVSSNAVSVQLKRLLNSKALIHPKFGVYALPDRSKVDFFVTNTDEVRQISEQIRQQFPFTIFCVWSSREIAPYMRHIPKLDFLLVDVERDAAEAVFNRLHADTSMRVFLTPTQTDFGRYIAGNEAVVVRPLISEAPLATVENIPSPAIEKFLVDMVGDVEFSFLSGIEMNYVYAAIFERHKVNKSKLLRYAARRGRKTKVQQLLDDNKL